METVNKSKGQVASTWDGRPAQGLVVLLHGYGSNGSDLWNAFAFLRQKFPELAFAAPDGPFQLQPGAFAWVKLSLPLNRQQLENGVIAGTPALQEYIDAELQQLGLAQDQLILIGFSQGAIMSLHIGVRRAAPPKAIIALAGFLVAKDKLFEAQSAPPVYLIIGEADEIVKAEQVKETEDALSRSGVPINTTLIPGLGHWVDERVFRKISDILTI
jgi:phospholipase/carboxylesterase